MTSFQALRVEKSDDGSFKRTVQERTVDELPPGDLLIDVRYSSLNYKDALSATGAPGVTRNYPHTPGIDVAGVVLDSQSEGFREGDEVIAIGFDLGMDTDGGFAQRVRIPATWALPLPAGLSLRESMILGTAGFTAALCIHKLEDAGMRPGHGPVLVTGATGGVGSVAVHLLSSLGYQAFAASGKSSQTEFLKALGAHEVLSREDVSNDSHRPLQREKWAGVVDTVGGDMMMNAIKALNYGASLAACGLVQSPTFTGTVLPFILRHVNLLGVDSVELPLDQKATIWDKLSSNWKIDSLESLATVLSLETLSDCIDKILEGKMVGRGLVDLSQT
ncbi:MAG: YhdH/YhfP family quinone oxidoreductase [Gammaproteobacteria bacterium]|nr:YhdH/YhfP family quinone oxidoreductase [Gammaproteobacteria bacterium]MYD79988.1 YhdH/YhfP family quinone oxidoreductase [Gammaproteobacteria bacterium]